VSMCQWSVEHPLLTPGDSDAGMQQPVAPAGCNRLALARPPATASGMALAAERLKLFVACPGTVLLMLWPGRRPGVGACRPRF